MDSRTRFEDYHRGSVNKAQKFEKKLDIIPMKKENMVDKIQKEDSALISEVNFFSLALVKLG